MYIIIGYNVLTMSGRLLEVVRLDKPYEVILKSKHSREIYRDTIRQEKQRKHRTYVRIDLVHYDYSDEELGSKVRALYHAYNVPLDRISFLFNISEIELKEKYL